MHRGTRTSSRTVSAVVGVAAALTGAGLLAAPTASAAEPGTASLASVLLASGGPSYDRNDHDYDILTGAVLAVLAAKPDSPVSVLTDGTKPLTAFLPDDRAFEDLVSTLTGKGVKTEQGNLAAIESLGIDTVERVLLYHVVPGATIDAKTAAASDGAVLTTAAGATLTVHVGGPIRIIDTSPVTRDAKVAVPDINAGNLQIAHGISRVLLPAS
ncbi:fasciclin domain-containing protein [Motilibacter rhizosphaerae]|uniref:Fasciclin domain-containing protein n=1 Tax=Motilibacter rhizosphaerae TaxID=598652 RepID=A0A4Q7NUR9_9ACTN|nr:fasciclin domain-containing protein [Motilibacter rhizosphaerae]RZS90834.1 fasciclin domain-containing protein [Motilibacter rhizosphaerae]